MKEKRLFDLIGEVDDSLVVEANNPAKKRTVPMWKKVTAVAACAAVVIGSITVYSKLDGRQKEPSAQQNTQQAAAAKPESTETTEALKATENAKALLDVVFPKAYAYDDYEKRTQVRDSNPVDSSFLKSVNQFSYDTASKLLSASNGNINYSPLSLYYALAVVATGANGKTQDELLSVLGVKDKETLSLQCGNLYRRLYTDNEIGKLKIANSVWLDKTLEWKKPFVKNVAENFYASVFSEDFSNSETASKISKWIKENTNGLLSPEINLMPNEIMAILNTVYFKGQWVNKFFEESTKQDDFNLENGTKVKCDFMNSMQSGQFTKGNGFMRSSLSFMGNTQMVFVLPDEGVSPKTLLSSPEKIKDIFEGGKEEYCDIIWSVPKFSSDSQINLVDMLKQSGINAAFGSEADFSGITDNQAFIGNVEQGTHIAIDENGAEAAAYTMIDICGTGAPTDRAEMILNRPFIYAITANDGTPLFVGICSNPSSQEDAQSDENTVNNNMTEKYSNGAEPENNNNMTEKYAGADESLANKEQTTSCPVNFESKPFDVLGVYGNINGIYYNNKEFFNKAAKLLYPKEKGFSVVYDAWDKTISVSNGNNFEEAFTSDEQRLIKKCFAVMETLAPDSVKFIRITNTESGKDPHNVTFEIESFGMADVSLMYCLQRISDAGVDKNWYKSFTMPVD